MTIPDRWFQVPTYAPAGPGPGSRALRIHAKTFGTVAAACGLNTYGLSKTWDLPFDAASPSACPECSRRVPPRAR